MEDTSAKFKRVVEKIGSILDQYVEIEEARIKLEEDNKKLKAQVKEQRDQLDAIQRQVEALKVAKTAASDEESIKEVRKRLNAYIREIDSCIARLNT